MGLEFMGLTAQIQQSRDAGTGGKTDALERMTQKAAEQAPKGPKACIEAVAAPPQIPVLHGCNMGRRR